MVYNGKYSLTKNKLQDYRKLLSLDLQNCLPYYNKEDIEKLNAKQFDYINITTITFDNGNYLTIDLVSGDSNYYDNIVLWDNLGNELSCYDCEFNLEDMKLEYENDIYLIKLEVV